MPEINWPIFQCKQIYELEQLANSKFELDGDKLMQNAGLAALECVKKYWPQVVNINIFCGAGNNGGDGFVLATLAKKHGLKPIVHLVGDHSKHRSEAQKAYEMCLTEKIPMQPFSANTIAEVDLIVDALCGIGVKEDLKQEFVDAITFMQSLQKPILSLDIPSGINADTGDVLGIAVNAKRTITFLGLKLGLLTCHGPAYTGDLDFSNLSVPPEIYNEVSPVAEKISIAQFAKYLQKRPKDWHKGLSGHALVIGGDVGFSGAARMAAEAALRVGAGLVSVATHPTNAPELNINCPEIMVHGIEKSKMLTPLLEKADVIILGPGLGQSSWSKDLWASIIDSKLPMVVDADALNLLAVKQKQNDNWVLTPHPGEAARLLNCHAKDIQHDRLFAAIKINEVYGGVCVLKGAGTLITAANTLTGLCDRGNPGMATAGMGDVLSGVIGGLLAQKVPLDDAAKLGVCLHATAGDLAAKEGERGTIATDLMPFLRQLANFSSE